MTKPEESKAVQACRALMLSSNSLARLLNEIDTPDDEDEIDFAKATELSNEARRLASEVTGIPVVPY